MPVQTQPTTHIVPEELEALGAAQLAAGSVTEAKLATNAVTAVKIKNTELTFEKLKTVATVPAKPAEKALTVGTRVVAGKTQTTLTGDGAKKEWKIEHFLNTLGITTQAYKMSAELPTETVAIEKVKIISATESEVFLTAAPGAAEEILIVTFG